MRVYTLRDKVAEENGRLFEAINDDVAVRMTKEILKNIPFKSDYSLLFLANFDSKTGLIHANDPIEIPIAWSPAEQEEEKEARQ